MANLSFNTIACAGANCANTGMPACTFKPGNIVGAILLPKGKTYTKAQLTAFQTALAADLTANLGSARIIPIKEFSTIEAADQEAVYETVGSSQYFVRDGKIGMNARIDDSFCLWTKLRNYNNKQGAFDIMLVDATNNVIWGTRTTDANGNVTGMKGFSLNTLSVPQFKTATTSTVFSFMFNFVIKSIKEFENSGFVQFDAMTDILGFLNGLIDYQIEVLTPITAPGVIVVKAKEGCGGTDLAPTYLANLAQVTAWSVTNGLDGSTIPVASATQNPATNSWTLTLTLPAVGVFPVGSPIIINSALPSVLAAAPINMPGRVGCPLTVSRV